MTISTNFLFSTLAVTLTTVLAGCSGDKPLSNADSTTPHMDAETATETQDDTHPFVAMLEGRIQSMRAAAKAGDWETYREFRTRSAATQMTERLAKMKLDLSINEMLKASAQHLKDPTDHKFLRCDVGGDGKLARISYQTEDAGLEGYWILIFHHENGQWRLGDSGNTITTPAPDRVPPTLESATRDLGLEFPEVTLIDTHSESTSLAIVAF